MRATFMILACLALAGTSVARAAEPDVAALQREVGQLKREVLRLQKRVDHLEGRHAAAAPAAPAAGYLTPEAALKATWHRIRRDMPQSDVVALLGEPSKKFVLDGRRGWYYYYPGTGGGSVFFTDAGRVSSRQSPFGLGW